jgi:hypothetical protein
MLLHVLIALFEQRRRKAARPVPRHVERRIEDGPVVLDCPRCQRLMIVRQYHMEEITGGPGAAQWTPTCTLFSCDGCEMVHLADRFENDGTGVYREKSWVCSGCQNRNSVRIRVCPHCRKRVPYFDLPT